MRAALEESGEPASERISVLRMALHEGPLAEPDAAWYNNDANFGPAIQQTLLLKQDPTPLFFQMGSEILRFMAKIPPSNTTSVVTWLARNHYFWSCGGNFTASNNI